MNNFEEKLRALLQNICKRPGLYVGKDDFEAVAHLINGISMGHQILTDSSRFDTFLDRFDSFLKTKYGANSLVWWCFLEKQYPGMGNRALISQLGRELEEYFEQRDAKKDQ